MGAASWPAAPALDGPPRAAPIAALWTVGLQNYSVLHDRNYRSIWEREHGEVIARRANLLEWHPWCLRFWFFTDSNPPERDKRTRARMPVILQKFGVVL
jgi:hypothetical protein